MRELAGLFVERADRVAERPRLVSVGRPHVAVVDATRDADGVERLVAALNAAGSRHFELSPVAGAATSVVVLIVDEHCSRSYRALLSAELSADRRVVVAEVGSADGDGDVVPVSLRAPSRLAFARRRDSVADAAGRLLERIGREAGQSSIALVAAVMLTFLAVTLFAEFGGSFIARGREQRATDLAATAAAARMSKDVVRVLAPPVLPNGLSNPAHLSSAEFRGRARAAAIASAAANGLRRREVRVTFGSGSPPSRVTVRARGVHSVEIGGDRRRVPVKTRSTAELRFSFASKSPPFRPRGRGGGYDGPLAYRQGKPMRPDVAAAFDRLAAAAARAGHALTIASALRTDAEQARIFAQRPDPKWVAPPGTSLHRYGTELDLGPPSAYAWLAAGARRFGFIKRYAWEPWHFGFGPNPRDVPAQYERGSFEPVDGSFVGPGGLPGWVPARFRPMIASAARRHNVQPVLLAAQLKTESNFNSSAVSPAGAQGIAQFMPGTARSVGLRDPFDPAQAIDAQARLMSRLIRQFRSIPKALAAYNAGSAAVQRFGGVPPYGETQAYVARILALIKGAGAALDDPAFAGIGFSSRVALVR